MRYETLLSFSLLPSSNFANRRLPVRRIRIEKARVPLKQMALPKARTEGKLTSSGRWGGQNNSNFGLRPVLWSVTPAQTIRTCWFEIKVHFKFTESFEIREGVAKRLLTCYLRLHLQWQTFLRNHVFTGYCILEFSGQTLCLPMSCDMFSLSV